LLGKRSCQGYRRQFSFVITMCLFESNCRRNLFFLRVVLESVMYIVERHLKCCLLKREQVIMIKELHKTSKMKLTDFKDVSVADFF